MLFIRDEADEVDEARPNVDPEEAGNDDDDDDGVDDILIEEEEILKALWCLCCDSANENERKGNCLNRRNATDIRRGDFKGLLLLAKGALDLKVLLIVLLNMYMEYASTAK